MDWHWHTKIIKKQQQKEQEQINKNNQFMSPSNKMRPYQFRTEKILLPLNFFFVPLLLHRLPLEIITIGLLAQLMIVKHTYNQTYIWEAISQRTMTATIECYLNKSIFTDCPNYIQMPARSIRRMKAI